MGAVVGYTQWRKELTGNARFKVAKDFFGVTYTLRNEVKHFRCRVYRQAEDAKDIDELTERWGRVLDAEGKFQAQKVDVECLLGADRVDRVDRVSDCLHELDIAVQAKRRDIKSGAENFKSNKDFALKIRRMLTHFPYEQDELDKNIEAAVKSIKDKLEPHVVGKAST